MSASIEDGVGSFRPSVDDDVPYIPVYSSCGSHAGMIAMASTVLTTPAMLASK